MIGHRVYSRKRIFENLHLLNLILLSGSICQVAYFSYTFIFALLMTGVATLYYPQHLLVNVKIVGSFIFCFVFIAAINYRFAEVKDIMEYVRIFCAVVLSSMIFLQLKTWSTNILDSLYKILKFLIYLSLIGFVFSFLDTGAEFVVSDTGYKAKTILNIFYYYAKVDVLGISFYRNQGIFWEPGVWCLYLNVFLLIVLSDKKYSNKNVVLALVAMFTTMSTTGLLISLVILLPWIKKNSHSFFSKLILGGMILGMGFIGVTSLLDKKAEAEIRQFSSYRDRLFDAYSAFRLACDHPLTGIGLSMDSYLKLKDKYVTSEISYAYNKSGNSNSIMMLLANWGLLVGSIVLYIFYRQSVFLKLKKKVFIVLVVSLFSEPLFLTPFFLFLLVSGYFDVVRKNIHVS